jgi:hypothetical protein
MGGVEIQTNIFLTPTIVGDAWSISRSGKESHMAVVSVGLRAVASSALLPHHSC